MPLINFKVELKLKWTNYCFLSANGNDNDNENANLNNIIDNYNVTINGKNFCDQPIDSDIKRYEEIRKLSTGQSEDYTTGCLLDYDHIKNNYRLIAVDLSR